MDWEIPSNFLQEEIRCEHLVTTKTKKLWLVELCCLKALDDICKKYNISYYAGGGTLLGAVRHHGYIPWDDDIDVFMNYQDYLRFCSIAPKELLDPFFFQNYLTEEGFGPGFSRIRHSGTTGCTRYDYAMATEHYNCGIFIDIFPLFNVENGLLKRKLQSLKISFWRLAIAGYESERSTRLRHFANKKKIHPSIWLWRVLSLFYSHVEVSNKFLQACSRSRSSNMVGLISFSGFNKRFIWKKISFDNPEDLPFEFIKIPCPSGFDHVLSTMYGDYHKFDKGGQIHSLVLCDPDTSYENSLKDMFCSYC